MSLLTNPVLLSVIVLCILCLFRLNVLLSLLISALSAALFAGIPILDAFNTLTAGFSVNANTALAYLLLGTFAVAIAETGLTEMVSNNMSKWIGSKKGIFLSVIASIACLSQNLVPVHIAFIPIMIPPLIVLMNRLQLDRRSVACSLSFGLKAPYIMLPFGFGAIFMGIIADNMTANGIQTTISDVTKVNWILGASMFLGLLVALFFTYRKPRAYKDVHLNLEKIEAPEFGYKHVVTIAAILAVGVAQVLTDTLSFSALCGLLIMFVFRATTYKKIDSMFKGGLEIMGLIAFIMLVAGGYAEVIKQTGAVDELVKSAADLMNGSKILAAMLITVIGLLVTMGIGSSFSTIPIVAVLYVPLCQQMGFSPAATVLLLSAAAALGDAGSPASDTTLGPTSGLNVDGQHNHIWDTCVPTFLHYNIPLMIAAIVGSQIL